MVPLRGQPEQQHDVEAVELVLREEDFIVHLPNVFLQVEVTHSNVII